MTPRQWQAVLAAALVTTAVLLQVAVLSRVPLPGATPGLALVTVVGIGFACGPTFGAVAGFGAGLALDVLPPAAGLMGATALALVVVGDLSGRIRDPRGLAPVQRAAVVAGLAALAAAIQLLFAVVFLARGLGLGVIVTELVTFAVTAALLGAAVVPVVSALLRRAGGQRRVRRTRAVPG